MIFQEYTALYDLHMYNIVYSYYRGLLLHGERRLIRAFLMVIEKRDLTQFHADLSSGRCPTTTFYLFQWGLCGMIEKYH